MGMVVKVMVVVISALLWGHTVGLHFVSLSLDRDRCLVVTGKS